jgi:nicotinamide mononucleotide transporter
VSTIEIIAVVFSLLCVWLSVRRSILNWPAGLIGVSAYLILFLQIKLYADATLQVFFLVQGVYGWVHWKKSQEKDHRIVVEYLTVHNRLLYCITIIAVTGCWGLLLAHYTDASIPYVDAFAATTSFFANWLMARKKIENWILWITADIVYIGLFFYKALYLSCGIYVIFLVLAIIGFVQWRRKSIPTALH